MRLFISKSEKKDTTPKKRQVFFLSKSKVKADYLYVPDLLHKTDEKLIVETVADAFVPMILHESQLVSLSKSKKGLVLLPSERNPKVKRWQKPKGLKVNKKLHQDVGKLKHKISSKLKDRNEAEAQRDYWIDRHSELVSNKASMKDIMAAKILVEALSVHASMFEHKPPNEHYDFATDKDGKVEGAIHYEYFDTKSYPHVYIHLLGTAGSARGTGVGATMLLKAMEEANKRNLPIELSPLDDAVGFYKKFGFTLDGDSEYMFIDKAGIKAAVENLRSYTGKAEADLSKEEWAYYRKAMIAEDRKGSFFLIGKIADVSKSLRKSKVRVDTTTRPIEKQYFNEAWAILEKPIKDRRHKFPEDKIREVIENYADRVARHNKIHQTKRLGFSSPKLEDAVTDEVSAMVENNVDLFSNVMAEYRAGELDANGVARRIELITRNEAQTLDGRLAQRRQEAAGIDKFKWQTMENTKVRPSHKKLNGKVYSWTKGAKVGKGKYIYPGQEIGCRCTPIPMVEIQHKSETVLVELTPAIASKHVMFKSLREVSNG